MADHEAIILDVDFPISQQMAFEPTSFDAIILDVDFGHADLIVSQHQREPYHSFNAVMLELGQQDPVTAVVEAVVVAEEKVYFQRALDSGTGGYVYWTSVGTPDPTPTPSETTPNFTGTLSVYTIVRILGCDN